MKVTLLLPHELGVWFSLLQERRSARVLPQSLVNPIYHLVAKPCPWLLSAKTILLLNFSFQLPSQSILLSSWRVFFSTLLSRQICLYPQITSFLSFLNKVAWVRIPIRGQAWKPYRWVPCPISSLTLEDGLPTTSLTGNSFLGQRIVEKLHPVGTGLVRVISTILGFPSPSLS
jgi:hypothetical protein